MTEKTVSRQSRAMAMAMAEAIHVKSRMLKDFMWVDGQERRAMRDGRRRFAGHSGLCSKLAVATNPAQSHLPLGFRQPPRLPCLALPAVINNHHLFPPTSCCALIPLSRYPLFCPALAAHLHLNFAILPSTLPSFCHAHPIAARPFLRCMHQTRPSVL